MAKIIALPDGTEAEFPDDMGDDEIAQVLQRQFGAPQPRGVESLVRQANLMPVPGEEEVAGMWARLPGETARTVAEHLPVAGGMLGGVLGAGAGPAGVVGGSALGASGGEAIRQLASRAMGGEAPETGAEAAGGIAAEGALAAGLTGAGYAGAAGSRMLRNVSPALIAGGKEAGKALYEGRGVTSAVLRGGEAAFKALKPGERKMIDAQIRHAVKRTAKEAGEAAAEGTAQVATQATRVAPAPIAAPVEAVQAVSKGPTKYQLAKALQAERGVSLPEAQRMVAEGVVPGRAAAPAQATGRITDQAANDARMAQQKAFLDSSAQEQSEYIIRRVQEMKANGYSIGQTADTLATETALGKTRLATITKSILGVK